MMENTATYIHFFVSEKTICAPTFIHSAHNKLIHFASPVCFKLHPCLRFQSYVYPVCTFVYPLCTFVYPFCTSVYLSA